MPDHVYKSIEVTGSSTKDVTDAIRRAVDKASETVRNIDWVEVVSIRGHVEDGSLEYLQVLPTLEIVSDNPVYDYDAKYTAGKSHHIIPARIPEAAREAASHAAGRAFMALGCSGMGRVDIIVDAAGTPWLLEVNTVPGLTELSLLPDAARAAGIKFDELCQRLVDHAIRRHEHHVGPPDP